MRPVVLDTNFLLAPYQFKRDILSSIDEVMREPYVLCILEGTLEELQTLLKSPKIKEREAAKFAIALVKSRKFRKLPSVGIVDEALIDLDNTYIIATQDSALRSRLRKQGKETLFIRQGQYVRLQ
ncbi:MAG: hypothetical protein Q7S65_01505 [Nanoarchaeota archaeon]|nr:hypothetical protein [Nanoarchaeota archaeon]